MTTEKDYPILVSIRCATYNHVNYIRKCLEGFVMQQTNFPFEAIVHDDASTDGTTEIVQEFADKYPDIIKPVFEKENVWSRHDGTLGRIFKEKLKGKYIAPCDGDDFWMDPMKLQMQVDFLESHPEYSMVHTGFNYIDMKGDAISTPEIPLYKNMVEKIKDGYIWDYLLVHSSFIMYSTILLRAEVLKKEPMGIDHGVFLSCARQGMIKYLPDITTSYRISDNSYMRTRQNRIAKAIENAIFNQLYYYCSTKYYTITYYRYNLRVRVAVADGILSSIAHHIRIKGEGKWKRLLFILFARPLNLFMIPFALIKKLVRRIS